jgi:hypothetical protein
MNSQFSGMLKRIRQQIATLEEAATALERLDDASNGEPMSQSTAPAKKRVKKSAKKVTMSAEARERIAAAQRKRWAAAKKGARKTATKKKS